MKTVSEVSRETGISVRTLHYYDQIGLLRPDAETESGYRLYGPAALERLGQILFFRSLEFPLKEIKAILDAPSFDPSEVLEQQIELLKLKRDHFDQLIALALNLQKEGGVAMDFNTFDTGRIDTYMEEVKQRWGTTEAYQEYESRTEEYRDGDWEKSEEKLMEQFKRFSGLTGLSCDDARVQEEVARLQQIITEHYYTCTDEILSSLGEMYTGDERFRELIDKFGKGTAAFAGKAIACYCKRGR